MIYFDDKTIHFTGIGGIGMSAIAACLHDMEIQVQGSDIAESANVTRLRDMGIKIVIGHKPENIKGADIVIISTATSEDNSEVVAARKAGIPVGHRAEMLAELLRYKKGIAVAGTHGKTTTTAMLVEIFEHAQLDPSFIIGGILNNIKTNSKNGSSDWMIVEADESDGSFLKLPKMVSVVNNIDSEHMDYYQNFENMKNAYRLFIESTAFYGFSAACIDHPVVRDVVQKIKQRWIVTYGFSPDAAVRADNLRIAPHQLIFDVHVHGKTYRDFELNMFGSHNVTNALGATAVALELGIDIKHIQAALANFKGVHRRFTKCGVSHGVSIFDDYAHHPVEIAAVLKAAKDALPDNKVIAVFQPHRYSRASDLADEFAACFENADTVLVADIYAAGEKEIPHINKDVFVRKIKACGHASVFALQSKEDLPKAVLSLASAGDLVVGLGAGDISKWMHELAIRMDQLA